jgi:PAS domain-containing protein
MVVEHLRDITEQIRAEDALRESEGRMRRILESTDDGFSNGMSVRRIFLSDRYYTLNGMSRASAATLTSGSASPPDDGTMPQSGLEHIHRRKESYFAE